MSSLIRKLEEVGKNNDIITPDSSDFDEPTPTNDNPTTNDTTTTTDTTKIIKSTDKEIIIDIDNEIIRTSPLVETEDTVIDISSNGQ